MRRVPSASKVAEEEKTSFKTFGKYVGFAWHHCRTHGLAYSAAAFCRELLFDWRHGIETTTPMELHAQDIPHSARLDSVQYQGADPKLVCALLDTLARDRQHTTFVDYGCGKGRILLLAAKSGFRRIVGVEFSPKVSAVCHENLAKTSRYHGGAEFKVHTMDAALFEPPAGPLVAFFYNPFSGATLEKVVQHLRKKAAQSPDSVTIVYVNPRGLPVFQANGFRVTESFLHKSQTLAIVATYRPEHSAQ